jgi:hypothetical protein
MYCGLSFLGLCTVDYGECLGSEKLQAKYPIKLTILDKYKAGSDRATGH